MTGFIRIRVEFLFGNQSSASYDAGEFLSRRPFYTSTLKLTQHPTAPRVSPSRGQLSPRPRPESVLWLPQSTGFLAGSCPL